MVDLDVMLAGFFHQLSQYSKQKLAEMKTKAGLLNINRIHTQILVLYKVHICALALCHCYKILIKIIVRRNE